MPKMVKKVYFKPTNVLLKHILTYKNIHCILANVHLKHKFHHIYLLPRRKF